MLPDLDGGGGSVLNGTESFGCSMEHEYVQRVSESPQTVTSLIRSTVSDHHGDLAVS